MAVLQSDLGSPGGRPRVTAGALFVVGLLLLGALVGVTAQLAEAVGTATWPSLLWGFLQAVVLAVVIGGSFSAAALATSVSTEKAPSRPADLSLLLGTAGVILMVLVPLFCFEVQIRTTAEQRNLVLAPLWFVFIVIVPAINLMGVGLALAAVPRRPVAGLIGTGLNATALLVACSCADFDPRMLLTI